MGKVSIVSLGCPKNLVDSDNLLGRLRDDGFSYVIEPADADIILVNTCGFIEDAKKESIDEILKLKEIKASGKRLIVFGCLAKRYRDELIQEIPDIDAIWGVGEEDKIVEYCKKFGARGNRQEEIGNSKIPLTHSPSPMASLSYAYLKIAEGCNRGCTFCVIPSIRGPYGSIEPDKVLRKAEEHIKAGAKELVLVAQDIGSYGREMEGYDLSSLLKDMASISGDFRIRLLYLYPTAVNDELLSVIGNEDKICRYLDIPLQHSEDKILKAMGRGGTKESYRRMIMHIREAIPDITLRTTFIVGFPGEAEDDFKGLKDFVMEMRFERLGVFTYSREEGTPAAKMKGNVPKKTKEIRRDAIMKMQSYISLEENRALVGKRFRALVDEMDGDVAIARIYSQAPEIDGVVFISNELSVTSNELKDSNEAIVTSHKLKNKGNPSLVTRHSSLLKTGEFVNVEIVEAYDYDLKGRVVL